MRKMPRESSRGEHTRTDPDYSPTSEVFDNMSHQEIHAKVQLLDPAALTAGQQAWQGSATGLGDAVTQAHTDIRGAIANGWRGAAADQAATAMQAFEQHGQDLADVLAAVAVRLGQAGDAAEALRAAVPGASGAEPDLNAALLNPGQASANVDSQKVAENARLDVVQAMETIYAGAFLTTGSGIPAFPDESTETATGSNGSTAPVSAVVAPALSPDTVGALPGGFLSTVAATTDLPVEASTVEEEQPVEEPTEAAAAEAESPAPDTTVAPAAAEAPAQTVSTATTSASTTFPAATAPAAATPGVPIAPAAATAPASMSTLAPLGTGTATTTEDNRKREERRPDSSSDAVTGLGAGAMGGLMGGALAAGDTSRPGSGMPAPTVRPGNDDFDDDELHFSDDELTFLEPADEAGELIGSMDPTTPPVLGEWTERE